MVSACALLLGGLLSRYAAINDRLRVLAREPFDLLRRYAPGDYEGATAAPMIREYLKSGSRC